MLNKKRKIVTDAFLPVEIIYMIILFLEPKDVYTLKKTSRRFGSVIVGTFWKQYFAARHFPVHRSLSSSRSVKGFWDKYLRCRDLFVFFQEPEGIVCQGSKCTLFVDMAELENVPKFVQKSLFIAPQRVVKLSFSHPFNASDIQIDLFEVKSDTDSVQMGFLVGDEVFRHLMDACKHVLYLNDVEIVEAFNPFVLCTFQNEHGESINLNEWMVNGKVKPPLKIWNSDVVYEFSGHSCQGLCHYELFLSLGPECGYESNYYLPEHHNWIKQCFYQIKDVEQHLWRFRRNPWMIHVKEKHVCLDPNMCQIDTDTINRHDGDKGWSCPSERCTALVFKF